MPEVRLRCAELERANLDPEAVWQLIDGTANRADGVDKLLTARINLDTLEGIVRSARSFGRAAEVVPAAVFCMHHGRVALDAGWVDLVDAFWRLKNDVYQSLIDRPSNILVEAKLSEDVAASVDADMIDNFMDIDDAWLSQHVSVSNGVDGAHLADLDARYELSRDAHHSAAAERSCKRYWVDESLPVPRDGLVLDAWTARYRHERHTSFVVRRHSASFSG